MVIIAHLGNAIAQRCSDAASQRYRPPGTCWSPPRLPPGKRLVDLWSRPVVPLLHSTVGPHPGAAAPQMGSGFGGLSHDRPFTAGFGARQGLGKAAGDSTPPRVDQRLLVPMWARGRSPQKPPPGFKGESPGSRTKGVITGQLIPRKSLRTHSSVLAAYNTCGPGSPRSSPGHPPSRPALPAGACCVKEPRAETRSCLAHMYACLGHYEVSQLNMLVDSPSGMKFGPCPPLILRVKTQ